MSPSRGSTLRGGGVALILFWISALLYVADIVLGKLGTMIVGFTSPLPLAAAGQFVLLIAVSVFLVAAALAAEARQDD